MKLKEIMDKYWRRASVTESDRKVVEMLAEALRKGKTATITTVCPRCGVPVTVVVRVVVTTDEEGRRKEIKVTEG